MMIKRVFCFLLTVVIICAFSVNSFAFGDLSFSDETLSNFYYNGNVIKSSAGYPGYHVKWANGSEFICKMNLCAPSNYVSSSIISLPITISNMKYFFVVKALAGPSVNITVSPSRYSSFGATEDCYVYLSYGYKNTSGEITYSSHNNSRAYVGAWDDSHIFKNNLIWLSGQMSTPLPILLYFNSYLYIIIPVYGSPGSYANSNLSFQQYESVRYSELKADELNAIGDFDSRFEGAENVGGLSASTDDLGGETTTIIDESSESEKYSEEFSKIDEMISNLDDFSSVAMSNYGEVSAVLGQVRGGIDEITSWLPKIVWALAMLGLIVIVAVKIIGR